jgi:hypothetical protein
LAALLLCVAAAPCAATNAITAITVRKERQVTSVAIEAIVHGDDDSSAVLRIFQRWRGAPRFDSGMVMIRRNHGPLPGIPGGTAIASGEIFEGRILDMTPGRIAEYWIEGSDDAGGLNAFSAAAPDTASCQPIRPLVATGPVFYVDQARGDDDNTGSSRARPTRTIGAALRRLSASALHGRNGGIFVAPGEYHERMTLDAALFPTDGDFHFIEGDGTNRDSTIICGANEEVESGNYAVGRPFEWRPTGQDSTFTAYCPAAAGPMDSTLLIVLGWGEYIERKTSIRAILDDSTYAYISCSTNGGERSGWFWEPTGSDPACPGCGDTLYLKRRSGESPADCKLHFGYRDRLIAVERRNWRIANLTLRFAGSMNGDPSHPANVCPPDIGGHGVVAGLRAMGSGLVVDSCRFYGFNASAVYVQHGFGGFHADSVVVANSVFSGPGLGGMNYGAGKSRPEEHASQATIVARASSFVGNTLFDLHNGWESGGTLDQSDSTRGSQCEVVGNTFTAIVDDAIEPDGSHAINTLIEHNVTRSCGSSGLSMTPLWTGPVFVLYNTFEDSRMTGIKTGGGHTAKVLAAHNTILSRVPGAKAVDATSGGTVDGLSFMNNILYSKSGIPLAGPPGSSPITNRFNYDLLGAAGNPALVQWNGTTESTLPGLRLRLGWEANGVAGALAAVDSTRGGLSPAGSSMCAGAGRRIPGVNTGLDGPRYGGNAPDLGAGELPHP